MIKIQGNAKINLSLDILGKREDGFHEVSMVMQTIGLHDTIVLRKRESGIALTINVPWLRADASNLAWRAASLMLKETGCRGGVEIELTKRIPVAAGLAGGSTDAAAVLRGLNQLYHLGVPRAKLLELGAQLGSDIPFCLLGGTMLATGRGEVLRRFPTLPKTWIVLAKPKLSVSTAWAYQHYDAEGADRHPDNAAIEACIRRRDVRGVAGRMENVLESVTVRAYEEIDWLKRRMLEGGAMASMMSGSGPTVFCFMDSREKAQALRDALREETNAFVYMTTTTGPYRHPRQKRFTRRRQKH